MPGFRYCSWCNGRGCVACDGEQKKFAEKNKGDMAIAMKMHELGRALNGMDSIPFDAIDRACAPPPKFGVPDFTARRDNPDDMALLGTFVGAKALGEIYADGRTPEADAELTRRLAEARLIQAARQVLCPNEADLAAERTATDPPTRTNP